MSIFGAAYPQGISVGNPGAGNVASTPQPTIKPAPTQQEMPSTPQPVTPQNATGIQEATPTPTVQPTAAATNPQASTQSLNMQATGYLIAVALAVSFTAVAAGFVVYKRKHAVK